MVIFLPESEGNLVCCKAIGKLTDEDLHNLTVRIERILENHACFYFTLIWNFLKAGNGKRHGIKTFMEGNTGTKSKKLPLSVTKSGNKRLKK